MLYVHQYSMSTDISKANRKFEILPIYWVYDARGSIDPILLIFGIIIIRKRYSMSFNLYIMYMETWASIHWFYPFLT